MLEIQKYSQDVKQLKDILVPVINRIYNLKRRKIMITVSRLQKVNNGSNLRAFADVVFGELVFVKGVRLVHSNSNGLFVSMPQQKTKDGKWYDIVRVLDDKLKQELQTVVLEAYNK